MNLLKKASSLCFGACLVTFTPLVAGLGITVDYTDGAGEDFFDSVDGAARRAAFEHTMSVWAAHLDGTIPLKIKAEFNPLPEKILGAAGVISAWANLPGFPEPGWAFVGALASQLNDNDRSDSSGRHLSVEFNSDRDLFPSTWPGDWYYGTDGLVPAGDSDFVTTALHEIGHGLGMIHQISSTTGEYQLSVGIPYLSHIFHSASWIHEPLFRRHDGRGTSRSNFQR